MLPKAVVANASSIALGMPIIALYINILMSRRMSELKKKVDPQIVSSGVAKTFFSQYTCTFEFKALCKL